MERIYIFGAHSRAQTLAVYLESLYPERKVEAYLYDNEERNPDKIGEVSVFRLGKGIQINTRYPVYIGTRGIYHAQLTDKLSKMGFKEIIPATPKLDRLLRNAYLEKYFVSLGREFLKIDMLEESADFGNKKEGHAANRIYVVQSALDKPLKQEYKLADYERVIQAGAELTKERLYPGVLTDNVGDNISAKNRQYCELTAIYWLWKHAKEEIVGLAHYRRHFILPDNWVQIMEEHEVDVILPTPLYAVPSIAENYKNRHDAADWEFMMCYLKEHSLEDYQEAEAFFEGNLYSPCNMFIMRKDVLDKFCGWLFPILDVAAAHGGQKEDGYQNRYPGFLSERLMTFYFEKNRDKYKMVYADKNFFM